MNRVRFESRAWHGGATTAAVLGVYFLSKRLTSLGPGFGQCPSRDSLHYLASNSNGPARFLSFIVMRTPRCCRRRSGRRWRRRDDKHDLYSVSLEKSGTQVHPDVGKVKESEKAVGSPKNDSPNLVKRQPYDPG